MTVMMRNSIIGGVGLLALCLLVWLLGPYLPMGDPSWLGSVAARATVCALILLTGAAVLAAVAWRRRAAAARMASALAAGASGDTTMARRDVEALEEKFNEAVKALKNSRRRGGVSLHELPWYVIVGPPGAGKTELLRNSGLRFSLADKFGNKAVRGVGGTRNCDWWFTDEAIFLDTAGRFVTQDSNESVDREAWLGFLDLLKRHRRRRPINGVLVAVSMLDVLTLDPHERARQISAIRTRIAELHRQFGMRFPVYAIVTKCDLVPGFVDFFDDLGAEDRGQVWGFTLDVAESRTLENLRERMHEQFAGLVERLQTRVIRRVHEERDLLRRADIFSFPDQVTAALEMVGSFIHEAFAPSSYDEPAFVRGLYLTSGTQDGSPIDRLMGGLARSFGIEAPVASAEMGRGRSYFITRLLRDVMFLESGLTGVDRRFERQRMWLQRGAYGGAITLTLLAAGAWAASYSINRAYLSDVADALKHYAELAAGEGNNDAAISTAGPRMDGMKQLLDVANRYAEGAPVGARFGLYQGEYIGLATKDAYAREVDSQLIPRIRVALERLLGDTSRDIYQLYEVLRLYLMLGDPDHFKLDDIVQATEVLVKLEGRPAADPATLAAHVRAGMAGQPRALPISSEAVSRARQRLASVPLEVFVLNAIKREYEQRGEAPLRLSDLIGPVGVSVVSRKSGASLDGAISPIFSRKGFVDAFLIEGNKRIGALTEQRWVLGGGDNRLAQLDLLALPARLANQYEKEYIAAWDGMLYDVQFARFTSLQDASNKLMMLSGIDSPIRSLLTAVANNSSLSELNVPSAGGAAVAGAVAGATQQVATSVDSAKGGLGSLLGPSPGGASAMNGPGAQIEARFKGLRDFVRGPSGAPGRMDAVLTMLSQVQQELSSYGGGLGQQLPGGAGLRSDSARRLQMEAAQLPPPVRQWLEQMATDINRILLGAASADVKTGIKQAGQGCAQLINGRYPFQRSAQIDAKMDDFARVFAAGGSLDTYFSTNLAALVDTSTAPWRWRAAEGGALGLSAGDLQQFERAAAIRNVFFADGKVPHVVMEVRPMSLSTDVAQVMLSIDGQAIDYRHGPIAGKRIEWPGKDSPGNVRYVLSRVNGTQQSKEFTGPWALFRFLDEAAKTGASPDRIVVAFGAGPSAAEFELISGSALNPLRGDLLPLFACPGGAS